MSRNCWAYVPVGVLLVALPIARYLSASPATLRPIDLSQAEKGRMLFLHEWTANDPLCPDGDGLGPVFNARSCVACHKQGGVGGSGGSESNVTTYVVRAPKSASGAPNSSDRAGLVHTHAIKPHLQESLQQVHPSLPRALPRPLVTTQREMGHCDVRTLFFPAGVHVSERKTPALFGARLIDQIPDAAIIANERRQQLRWALGSAEGDQLPVGRAARLPNDRIGHFGWKAQSASLEQFVQAACANELGLSNPARQQPSPLSFASYVPPGHDLTLEQCREIASFIETLPRPIERLPASGGGESHVERGRALFGSVGCADCHQPDVAEILGLYSDLLLHDMGPDGSGGGSYGDPPPEIPEVASAGPRPSEWRTPPLWGVADSGPWLHDGRARTLEEAIQGHGGQGNRARQRFGKLRPEDRDQLLAFLESLRAPIDDLPQ